MLAALAAFCLSVAGHASLPKRFIETSDGAFDLSEHLLELSGFLSVPIIVTEPALGYGGGAAIVYSD